MQVKSRSEIEQLLRHYRKDLEAEFGVSELGLFGSYARGEQTDKSDVDILVQFERPISLFRFIALEEQLSKIVECKVDLVTKKGLKPFIGRRILSEVVYL